MMVETTCPACTKPFQCDPLADPAPPLQTSIHEPWIRCPHCKEPILFFSKVSDPTDWSIDGADVPE